MKKAISISLISTIILINFTYGQSYYYKNDLRKNKQGFIVHNIYGINLQSGEKKLILSEVGTPAILSEINKIMFKSIPESQICIYDLQKNSTDTLSYLGKIELKNQNHTVPPDNHIFLSYVKFGAKIISKEFHTLESTDILIDKNTYSIIDTNCYYFKATKSLISREGSEIYYLIDLKDGVYFKSRSTLTGEIINERITIEGYEYVQMKYNPYFIDSQNGYAFIGYLSEKDDKGHLVLCDPANKTASSQIILPVGIPPYEKCLTPYGNMVFQDGGNIYIYNKNTAKLKQRLRFQTSDIPDAESKIFMLGDSLYFFPEDPKESDATHFENIGHADLTEVQSNSSLVDMMSKDIDNSYQKGWIDNKGIYNSLTKKLKHAQKQLDKRNIKQAINQLKAFLNQLEAQRVKHVNEEAYNLLHFNAEALIERME
ncbi:MAG: hypothetical protein U5R06_13515 [candidate division KSB1 bacterium]|nr:hypothetical protein [candidate division KSB1 bacterium]